MSKIKELPKLERPREKAIRYGFDKLSDSELLALFLVTGYKGNNAVQLADILLNDYNGLIGLKSSSLKQMSLVKGLGITKAISIAAIFEIHKRLLLKEIEEKEANYPKIDSDYLASKYIPILKDSDQENVMLIVVDKRKRIIKEECLYKGTSSEVIFSYKDIWKSVLVSNGSYFYLIHNHPNGDTTPSNKDVLYTNEILRESKRFGVPLLDHIIVGKNSYYSLVKNQKF